MSRTFRELLADDRRHPARWGVVECDLSGPLALWYARRVLTRARARHPAMVARAEVKLAALAAEERLRAARG